MESNRYNEPKADSEFTRSQMMSPPLAVANSSNKPNINKKYISLEERRSTQKQSTKDQK